MIPSLTSHAAHCPCTHVEVTPAGERTGHPVLLAVLGLYLRLLMGRAWR